MADNGQANIDKLRAQALKLLARREHSRTELALKLQRRQWQLSQIEQVLDDFEERNWLNDQRFAEIFARQRRERGYGPLRIKADLHQRGIYRVPAPSEEEGPIDWIGIATNALERRFGSQAGPDSEPDRNLWLKRARFLAQRGFESDQISEAIDRYTRQQEEC